VPIWIFTHTHAARMARLPRIDVPNVPQPAVQRGNNRQAIFFTTTDYHAYLGCLREALIKHDCSLDAYVPMTHHVHVLTLGQVTGAMSRWMQSVSRRYVRYILRQKPNTPHR
jgi:putative transposase